MKLSIVIPAYNEAQSIAGTVPAIYDALLKENIAHEIIVVNDNSKDNTFEALQKLSQTIPTLKVYTSEYPGGFGFAVRYGLDKYTGDCVAVMMADLSDSPQDLIIFYRKMQEGYDCVFGSRFVKGSKVYDYPRFKFYMNRIFNTAVRLSFKLEYNDLTNAFKMYRRETIDGIRPLLSPHFNLTLELPLKSIIRGYSYAVVPNSWSNRKFGESKLKLQEMGSRYFFIFLYCMIEKLFSMGDFNKSKKGIK
jgi:dolichol-phosphate mannosyltransferase